MGSRDDFPRKVRTAVALRAGHRCSFLDCYQSTVGPSDEAPDAVAMIGEAAHIHAAAAGRGARRYLASMPSEERSNIDNAIWLCANHARLIDRDEITYSPDALRAMKLAHEAKCAADLRQSKGAKETTGELIAIGPDVICVGEMLEGTEDNWSFSLLHFIEGDIHALISFIENFRKSDDYDRYICIGSLGDGRVLRAAPSWKRQNGAYVVQCPTFQAFPRRSAFELGGDFALSADNDLIVENGDIALVRGVAALPQKIRLTLSRQRGLDPFYKKFGTRIAEYYSLLRNSVWLEQLIKLELIRMASIPYPDPTLKQRDTPLQCVERVFGVVVAGEASADGWLPLKVELHVKGLGRWNYESSAFVKNIKPRLSPEETFR